MKLAAGALLLIFHSLTSIHSFIIPDELPSLLSVIYSNIPTLKKGTDSRIGWGFRLGERADVQVLVELGPQLNTQPLANQGESNTIKRNTLNNLANTLYAQRQQEKANKLAKEQDERNSTKSAQWLQDWSKTVNNINEPEEQSVDAPQPKPGIAIGEIDAKSVLPDDEQLAKMEARKIKMKKAVIESLMTQKPSS